MIVTEQRRQRRVLEMDVGRVGGVGRGRIGDDGLEMLLPAERHEPLERAVEDARLDDAGAQQTGIVDLAVVAVLDVEGDIVAGKDQRVAEVRRGRQSAPQHHQAGVDTLVDLVEAGHEEIPGIAAPADGVAEPPAEVGTAAALVGPLEQSSALLRRGDVAQMQEGVLQVVALVDVHDHDVRMPGEPEVDQDLQILVGPDAVLAEIVDAAVEQDAELGRPAVARPRRGAGGERVAERDDVALRVVGRVPGGIAEAVAVEGDGD